MLASLCVYNVSFIPEAEQIIKQDYFLPLLSIFCTAANKYSFLQYLDQDLVGKCIRDLELKPSCFLNLHQ